MKLIISRHRGRSGARGVLCAAHKRLLIVPRTGHGLSYILDREAYLAALREFLEVH